MKALEVKYSIVNVNIDYNIFKSEDQLMQLIKKVDNYEKRDQFKEIINWLNTDTRGRILGLYGLRRTGKTVLLLQVCKYLMAKGLRVVYGELNSNINQVNFFNTIESLSTSHKYDVIIVDEITSIDGLLTCGNQLSDICSGFGQKIIVTGTQSLMLDIAENDILYDRIDFIDTTYLSYKEYERLFKSDIMSYIKWGGILSSSKLINDKGRWNYIRTAIVDNLTHTFQCYKNSFRDWPELYTSYEENILISVLQIFIANIGRQSLENYINKEYRDNYLGSTLQLLRSKINISNDDRIAINEEVKDRLKIIGNKIEMSSFSKTRILNLFERLHLITFTNNDSLIEERSNQVYDTKSKDIKSYKLHRTKETVFIQPALQYEQVIESLDIILSTKLSNNDKQLIKNKLIEDIEGRLLEQVIRLNLMMKYKEQKYLVTGLRIQNRAEIDILISHEDIGTILIEVKRTDKIDENQCRWLCNKDVSEIIEKWYGKILSRYVLYNGKTQDINISGYKVNYYNITEFLLN